MGKAMSLDDLAKYVGQTVDKVRAARKELAEVQVGFNSKYVERKAEHDATLERLVQGIVLRFDEVGPDLRGRIEALLPEERQIATGRYQALEQKLVQEAQAQAALKENPDHSQRSPPQSEWVLASGGLLVDRPEADQRVEFVGERDGDRDRVGRHIIRRPLRLVVLLDGGGD